MAVPLSHIALELAPCLEHRFGDAQHIYDLYLPLGADGRLDLQALQQGETGVVRRLKPSGHELRGRIALTREGRLAFDFPLRASNHAPGFPSPPDRFVIGRTLKIVEDDGEPRPFQVIAIRRPLQGDGRDEISLAQ